MHNLLSTVKRFAKNFGRHKIFNGSIFPKILKARQFFLGMSYTVGKFIKEPSTTKSVVETSFFHSVWTCSCCEDCGSVHNLDIISPQLRASRFVNNTFLPIISLKAADSGKLWQDLA